MSEVLTMMRFELIPNEILMECFGYLSASEIFHAFDRLNYRFCKLIRNIQLYLNFHHIRKSLFDRFCKKMLLEPHIKIKIYSMHLSNKGSHDQIETFLSLFSIDEFPNLRSLTLTQVTYENIEKVRSMLSSIPELYSLHLIDSENIEAGTLVPLTTSKVRILSADTLVVLPTWFERFLSITSFTVLSSEVFDLCRLMEYMPMLKYLHVEHCIYMGKSYTKQARYKKTCAIDLKQLIVDDLEFRFETFQKLLETTPNLKSLTLSAGGRPDMFDACQWEHLISSSLPYLKIFKFRFGCAFVYFDNDYINMFERFQNDFWHKQHHWYTECLLTKSSIFIYTTSYASYKDRLRMTTNENIYISSISLFDATDLTSRQQEIEQKCQSYFKNIVSCKIETSSILLQILKEAPQLSTITIDQKQLISFCNDDDELCNYLSKMIQKLDLWHDNDRSTPAFNNYAELRKFCKIFSNVEDLRCYIDKKTEFLFVLNQLSKLSNTTIFMTTSDNRKSVLNWIKKELTKLNVNYHIDSNRWYAGDDHVMVNIWMG
ncbi:unnamed protein product [Rotaria sp. Silwood1]|nr:unnamed protein product [Rotaria sp. Silwood1]